MYCQAAPHGGCSIEEFPRICTIEAPDDHRLEELWLEVAQIHPVPSAGFGIQWFPVSDNAARFATHVPQRPVTPDIVLRVRGMTLNRHCAQLVVGPNAPGPTAERAIAARSLIWRKWKSEANCSAMTGTVKRRCWLLVPHGSQSWVAVRLTPESSRPARRARLRFNYSARAGSAPRARIERVVRSVDRMSVPCACAQAIAMRLQVQQLSIRRQQQARLPKSLQVVRNLPRTRSA